MFHCCLCYIGPQLNSVQAPARFEKIISGATLLILTYLLTCTVSKLWLIIGQIFASERGVPHFNALAGGDPLPISPYMIYRQKTKFFGLHFHCRKHRCIFNDFYVIHPTATEFSEIMLPLELLRRSKFKVTEFGTNQKLICDFLLVIILP